MTVFYETAAGVCAGQLIERYAASVLVLLESENGRQVRGNVYSLVTLPESKDAGDQEVRTL
jgi:hypothetical protein